MNNRRRFLNSVVVVPLATFLPTAQAGPFDALTRRYGLPPGLLDQLWAAEFANQDAQQRLRMRHLFGGDAIVIR